jgi:multiple sugar transport system substrate-binding protein
MPAAPGGVPTAALGGAGLAVNAFSDQPDEAYALIDYLLQPAQMLERARDAGQFPSRRDLYASDDGPLAGVLAVRPSDVRRIVEHAVPRPVTPVYTELSELLQVALHRALTRQQAPSDALHGAAASMRALLDRAGLAPAER